MLAEQGVEGNGVLEALARHDFVALEAEAAELGVDPDPILDVNQRRGGPRCSRACPATPSSGMRGAERLHALLEADVAGRIIFDLGLVRRLGYYKGAVFEVYDPGMGEPLGGGGRYDELCGRFGRPLPAVGFALGVDALHVALAGDGASPARRSPGLRGKRTMNGYGLTVAVPRGALFRGDPRPARRAGDRHRRGAVERPQAALRDAGIVTMRPSDVPTYVESGAADIGITGKDVLSEQAGRRVYELLDLGFGGTRMVLATVAGEPDPASEALRRLGVVRVATKYPKIANRLLRGDRTPGGDRRGQGLGRAGAADRDGRGHRRPHADRDDAARRTGSSCARRSSPRRRG